MARSSEAFYKRLWEEEIFPEMKNLSRQDGIFVVDEEKSYKKIRNVYRSLNRHCKENYMEDSSEPLDRHKVAACYMLAIINCRPLGVDFEQCDCLPEDDLRMFANERLSVAVGKSIILSYLKLAIEDPETELTNAKRDFALKVLDETSLHPYQVGHGDYYENFLKTLCATQIERSYNILMLANILFLWENNSIPNEYLTPILKRYADMSRDERENRFLHV